MIFCTRACLGEGLVGVPAELLQSVESVEQCRSVTGQTVSTWGQTVCK